MRHIMLSLMLISFTAIAQPQSIIKEQYLALKAGKMDAIEFKCSSITFRLERGTFNKFTLYRRDGLNWEKLSNVNFLDTGLEFLPHKIGHKVKLKKLSYLLQLPNHAVELTSRYLPYHYYNHRKDLTQNERSAIARNRFGYQIDLYEGRDTIYNVNRTVVYLALDEDRYRHDQNNDYVLPRDTFSTSEYPDKELEKTRSEIAEIEDRTINSVLIFGELKSRFELLKKMETNYLEDIDRRETFKQEQIDKNIQRNRAINESIAKHGLVTIEIPAEQYRETRSCHSL